MATSLRLSPSGISTFEQCELRWKYRYIDQLPDKAGKEAVLGTIVHRALELHFGGVDLKPACREAWDEAREALDELALGEDAEKSMRWSVLELCEVALRPKFTPVGSSVVQTERQFRIDYDGVTLNGIVDRLVEREVKGVRLTVIEDYKTGKMPLRRFMPDKFKQLHFYAAALSLEGEKAHSVGLLYLKGNPAYENVTPVTITTALDRVKSTRDAICDRMESGDFQPKPSKLCGWCPQYDICPAEGKP